MSLASFVVVWVAVWAVAWWSLRGGVRVVRLKPPQTRVAGGVTYLAHSDTVVEPCRRHVAPYFATAVAWLFELVRWVASGCVVVALAGCCAVSRDAGTFRRQDASDPVTTPRLAGWPDGWVYERVTDEGVDVNGIPYRFTRGGYGATPSEAVSNAR